MLSLSMLVVMLGLTVAAAAEGAELNSPNRLPAVPQESLERCRVLSAPITDVRGTTVAPRSVSTSALPAGARVWQTIPRVILAQGNPSCRVAGLASRAAKRGLMRPAALCWDSP